MNASIAHANAEGNQAESEIEQQSPMLEKILKKKKSKPEAAQRRSAFRNHPDDANNPNQARERHLMRINRR